MGLETGDYVLDLVATNPISSDTKGQGDDHIRLLKKVLRATFPDASRPIRRNKAEIVTGDTEVAAADENTFYTVDASSLAVEITLPTLTADDAGFQITVQKVDSSSNAVVFEPGSAQINGLDNVRISSQYTAARLFWTGTSWRAYYTFGYIADDDPMQALINRVIPAGSSWVDWATSLPTGGYVYLYGALLSRTTYPALFTRWGTTYGAGDGSTTFGSPDVRGRVIAGQDDIGGSSANRLTGVTGSVNGDTLGAVGGAETHTLVTAEIPSHAHSYNEGFVGQGADAGGGSNSLSIRSQTTGETGGDGAHNNVQPTIIGNWIAKAH